MSYEICGDGDVVFDGQISIGAYLFKFFQIICAGKKEGVVDRYEVAVVVDERADFVDDAGVAFG